MLKKGSLLETGILSSSAVLIIDLPVPMLAEGTIDWHNLVKFLLHTPFTEVKWSISKKSIVFQGSRWGPGGGGGGPIAYSL